MNKNEVIPVITDKVLIRKALGLTNNSMPDSFLPRELKAVGKARYKGDKMPKPCNNTDFFKIGNYYYLYCFEGQDVFMNDEGQSRKVIPAEWTKIHWF